MDYSEATKVLFDRIKKIDPEKPNKTLGYILLQDPEEGNLIRLAHAPDQFLDNLVQKTKHHFEFLAKSPASASNGAPSINISTVPDIPLQFGPFSANSLRSYSSPVSIRIPTSTTCDSAQLQVNLQPNLSQDFAAFNYGDSAVEEYGIQSQAQFVGYDNQFDPVSGGGSASYPEDFYHPDATLGNRRSRTSRRSPSLPEFPIKTCHYYKRGFCKHGNSCRFFHGPEKFSSVFASNSSNELSLVDDHVFSPGSREKLELEITELLKLRRGNPVSIASLPMLYYEKYGRHIQAEGYLTESQRHGRAGYSLTKLLARLSSIQLVDRPHGQHSVILAEDAAKYYLENFGDRNDPGPIVCGSRQIYLTFPAESTFSEEDVSNYFSNFGHVEEVRIPCQQKRMFGFVTFASADTVKSVLAKRNPHFVCGSRVLVKPYREKSKLIERKYMEKSEHPINYTGSYFELEHDFHSLPRGCDAPRFLRRQLTEKQEQALEFERRRLSELQLMQNHFSNQPCLAYAMENLDASEDQYKFTSPENLNNFYDALNIGSSSNDRSTHEATKYSDQESQGIGLPDNPFTGAIGSSISTVT